MCYSGGHPCPRSVSSLGEDWFYIDEVVALSVVSGTDEAVSKGHLSILWTGGC